MKLDQVIEFAKKVKLSNNFLDISAVVNKKIIAFPQHNKYNTSIFGQIIEGVIEEKKATSAIIFADCFTDDPDHKECLIFYQFDNKGNEKNIIIPYEHKGEHIVFQEPVDGSKNDLFSDFTPFNPWKKLTTLDVFAKIHCNSKTMEKGITACEITNAGNTDYFVAYKQKRKKVEKEEFLAFIKKHKLNEVSNQISKVVFDKENRTARVNPPPTDNRCQRCGKQTDLSESFEDIDGITQPIWVCSDCDKEN